MALINSLATHARIKQVWLHSKAPYRKVVKGKQTAESRSSCPAMKNRSIRSPRPNASGEVTRRRAAERIRQPARLSLAGSDHGFSKDDIQFMDCFPESRLCRLPALAYSVP